MARRQPLLPTSHGKPHVDDRRVTSGIILLNRNGLGWRDTPKAQRMSSGSQRAICGKAMTSDSATTWRPTKGSEER